MLGGQKCVVLASTYNSAVPIVPGTHMNNFYFHYDTAHHSS